MNSDENVPALLLDPLDCAYLEALTQLGFDQLLLRGDWKTAQEAQAAKGVKWEIKVSVSKHSAT